MISYIVPTYNRKEILLWHLAELNNQTFKDFEVIVVNDGGESVEVDDSNYNYPVVVIYQKNSGPGAARNTGAEIAKHDIILFAGDDAIPDRNLLWRHFYNHIRDMKPKAVQGYTPWHLDMAGDEFHQFLTHQGLQANWNALRTENGGWKYDIPANFCLTTNYSINKRLFENLGGFDPFLSAAAWDDIELGYRAMRSQIKTVFDSGAVNYHYHRYTLGQFAERQKKEGYWRVALCLIHPEATSSLLPPRDIVEAESEDLDELIHWAKELDFVSPTEKIIEERHQRWHHALKIASLQGAARGLDEFHPALKAAKYMPNDESVLMVISAVSGLRRGHKAYALHCIAWLHDLKRTPFTHAFAGEIYAGIGNRLAAKQEFEQSLAMEANEWARTRLSQL